MRRTPESAGGSVSWALREDPDAIATAAARIEEATDLPAAHVEKDFWVTEVLRGVAQQTAETGVSAIFKGGTSLSKAHGLIKRFSEDVDIIVVVPGKSPGSDDKCLKGFVVAAEATTGLASVVDPATATKGKKRTAIFGYPTASRSGPYGRAYCWSWVPVVARCPQHGDRSPV
jgi:hypothetical protein